MAEVEVTREGAVLTITLNRPDVLNALNRAVHEALHAALDEAGDPGVRAVVITGAGRGFCVGQDLQEFRAGAGDVAANLRRNYHRNVLAIARVVEGVVARIGTCLPPVAGRDYVLLDQRCRFSAADAAAARRASYPGGTAGSA